MTAPTTHRRPLPALDALRAAHANADADFTIHSTLTCQDGCLTGGLCHLGERLRDDADTAGRRWEWAQTGKWGTW